MSEETAKPVDKSEWLRGPWDNEPDRVEFRHAGHACLMSRGPGGHWCGYVAVNPGHPAYEKHYDDDSLDRVSAHGGLTYADHCQGHVCHVPAPGEPDNVWWLGFDCAHGGDLSPARNWRFSRNDTYKDAAYVRAETEQLAEQLAVLAT